MKKYFSILILLIGFSAFSQVKLDSSDHLTFKGVPIDGTLNEFVLKMKKSGFTHLGTEDGLAMLKGDFAGYKNCYVGVTSLDQKDLVSKIGVMFSDKDTWSTLASNYFRLKELLTEKYGEPSEVVEEFQTQSQPRTDSDKMYKVLFDECTYYTTYETDKGSIQLSIEHNGVSSSYVKLFYFDKINGSIIRAKAIDDL